VSLKGDTSHTAETIGIAPAQLGRLNYVAHMIGTASKACSQSKTKPTRCSAGNATYRILEAHICRKLSANLIAHYSWVPC
jgi:hypothetical protein